MTKHVCNGWALLTIIMLSPIGDAVGSHSPLSPGAAMMRLPSVSAASMQVE